MRGRSLAERATVLRSPRGLAGAAATLAVVVGVVVLPSAAQPAPWLGVLALFLAFAVTESVQLDVELRRQTFTLTPTDLVIVISLVEIGGLWTAVARAAALLLVQLYGRYSPAKAVFNVALAVLDVAVAVAVLRLFPERDLTSPVTWLALVTAIAAVGTVSVVCVAVAITLTEGPPSRRFWTSALAPQFVIGPLSVAAGVAAVLLVRSTPWAWLLVLPVLSAIVATFRLSASTARERRSVERVYDFARRVESISPDDTGTREMVAAVRELLNADTVALWLPAYLDEPPRLVVDTADGAAACSDGPGDPDDPLRRRALDAEAPGPVLVTAGRADEAEARALVRRGASEVLGAPVVTAAGEPGYLEVRDRRSAVLSFAHDDRAALDSMLTHVNAAIRQQQLLTRIRYDADHDRLTGLPNRQRLAVEVDELLATDPGSGRAGLVLAMLDNYTEVTDTLGHAASDELLLVTAELLREHAPPQALVARMEAGKFAVLLPGLSLAATERAARRLREATSARARVAGLDLEVTLIIGVAMAPVHGGDAGTLMQRADVALLAAAAGGGVASYHAVLDQQSLRRLHLGAELEQAMDERQITVVFQPIVDARSSDIVSVETLVRWAHPRYGAVGPDEFISLAEQIGRIGALTDHVLDLALARCRRWLDEDIALSVAVNLSAHCLGESDLVDRVRGALGRHGVPGELLTLELTEGSVVDATVRGSTVLADLHALGLRLSMDDFGTGYSSLSQLRRLPIDEVKIDKSFVLGMATGQGESFIARSIIELAHNLGLQVVAEGVEDEVTRNVLAEMGCDKLQGFLVSRPLPEDKLESWLLARAGVRSATPGTAHRRLFVRA